MRYFICLLAISTLLISCNKEDRIRTDNEEEIRDYLSVQGLSAQETESGLFYIIETVGDGDHPSIADDVTVNYTGYLTTGDVFDANDDITFPLSGVIVGWQEGIPLFSRGGSGKLLIPSHLAYGENSPSESIPKNSVLIFDIDLIDF